MRCGHLRDVARVVVPVVQGCIRLKFYMDTLGVGKRERGESCAVRESMASEN